MRGAYGNARRQAVGGTHARNVTCITIYMKKVVVVEVVAWHTEGAYGCVVRIARYARVWRDMAARVARW